MVKKAAAALSRKTQNAFELKGGVNGLKTIIGVTLIVLAAQIPALTQVCTEYPDLCGYTAPALAYIGIALEWLKFALENTGKLLAWVGVFAKFIKFFKG